MTSACKLLAGLALAFAASTAAAGPVVPVLPCDRPVLVAGGASTLNAKGVRLVGRNDFNSRVRTFFQRVCRTEVPVRTFADEDGRLLDDLGEIETVLREVRPSVALIDYSYGDIAADASIADMMNGYAALLQTCKATSTLCIIGGQRPGNALDDVRSERQLELERRASATFGESYLPTYAHFRSEGYGRRLMTRLDSGDGRVINDIGHEMLFIVYRNRLLERTGSIR